LLVTGKNIAQTFWANAATRLHPEEWVTGLASGAAAALMFEEGFNSTAQVYASYPKLAALLASPKAYSPLDWSLPS
jgi:hypothetical protein